MKVSNAMVNKVLKEKFRIANVKMKKDYSGYDTITVKQHGKMVKGIYLTDHSPMDCTSAASERLTATFNKVKHELMYGDTVQLKDTERGLLVSENSKSATYLSLDVQRIRTYAHCMDLDDGYVTSYIVPYFYKVAK